jgi:hypothetical protein
VERSGRAKMSFFLLNKKPVEKNIIFARHAWINVYFCRKLPRWWVHKLIFISTMLRQPWTPLNVHRLFFGNG